MTPSGLYECQGCRLISTIKSVFSDLRPCIIVAPSTMLLTKATGATSAPLAKSGVPLSKVPVSLAYGHSCSSQHCVLSEHQQVLSSFHLLISPSLPHHPGTSARPQQGATQPHFSADRQSSKRTSTEAVQQLRRAQLAAARALCGIAKQVGTTCNMRLSSRKAHLQRTWLNSATGHTHGAASICSPSWHVQHLEASQASQAAHYEKIAVQLQQLCIAAVSDC